MTSTKALPWVLGIASSHNGAACLLHGDEIVAAVQEERLLRSKRARVQAAFGSLAVRYCLDHAGISPADLALVVACGQEPRSRTAERLELCPVFRDASRQLPLLSIPHHLGHAVGAFATSGFEDAAILVVDGMGSPWEDLAAAERAAVLDPIPRGGETVSLYHATGTEIVPIEKHLVEACFVRRPSGMPEFGSLGWMYGAVGTQIFGDANDGAGKVMGLAPYGTPTLPVADFFTIERGRFVFSDRVPDLFGHNDRWPLRRDEYADLAASTQAALEHGLMHLLHRLCALAPGPRLCYAGGVALNSVANEKIVRDGAFAEVFLMPAAEDSGTAIGAAYYGLFQLTGRNRCRRLVHDAVGRPYSAAEVGRAIESAPATVASAPSDLIDEVARELCEGKIVGWFDGRSELGPRALGQRSILCDPRRPDMKDILNLRVKRRERFRPFAPVILLEEARAWFELDGVSAESPAMLRVAPIRPEKRALVPAVVHVDGTGRLQTVTAGANGRLHALIQRFFALTGVPLLLNTSFNVAGEPIVETPEDALFGLLYAGLDACVLGDRMVRVKPGHGSILDLEVEVIVRSIAAFGPRSGADARAARVGWASAALEAAPAIDARYKGLGEPYVRIDVATPWGGAVYFAGIEVLDVLDRATGRATGRQILELLHARTESTMDENELVHLLGRLRRARVIALHESQAAATTARLQIEQEDPVEQRRQDPVAIGSPPICT